MLGESDHPLELGPIRRARALGFIDELLDHAPAVPLRVLAQRLELGRDREVLLGLPFGRNARVKRRPNLAAAWNFIVHLLPLSSPEP